MKCSAALQVYLQAAFVLKKMIFYSLQFLIFIVLLIIFLLAINRIFRKKRNHYRLARNAGLLIASYVFYCFWDWKCAFILLFLTAETFFLGFFCREKKAARIAGIVLPLLVLFVFKYFNFFVKSFAGLFHISNAAGLNLIIPVGISFYVFQAVSYIADVSKEKYPFERNFIDFALFLSFFPRLTSGPIVRADYFLPQLKEERGVNLKNAEAGVQIFIMGLFKKIVLADRLAIFVDEVFNTPKAFSWATVILATLAYTLQIYFDFSGYSDMAVGIARLLGFDLPRNFNLPYIAANVTEFWKRWHITLSDWLKDYVYIPLGGNRKGEFFTLLNLFLTMLIGGLWHGADWTFVAWGALHGIGLIIHKIWGKYRNRKGDTATCFGLFSGRLLTFLFVNFCWIFFRADSFGKAWDIISQMVFLRDGVDHFYITVYIAFAFLIAAVLFARHHRKKNGIIGKYGVEGYYPILDLRKFWSWVALFSAVGIIILFAYVGSSPFIYAQF